MDGSVGILWEMSVGMPPMSNLRTRQQGVAECIRNGHVIHVRLSRPWSTAEGCHRRVGKPLVDRANRCADPTQWGLGVDSWWSLPC